MAAFFTIKQFKFVLILYIELSYYITSWLRQPYNIKVEDPSGTRDKAQSWGTVPEIEGRLEPMLLYRGLELAV